MATQRPLPLARYAGDQLFLSALLLGSFVLLPRSSTRARAGGAFIQQSSLDRPEHPFLTPLTARPAETILWTLPGTASCMIWWGQRLKAWWAVQPAPTAQKERVQGSIKRIQHALVVTLSTSIGILMLLLGLGAPLHQHLLRTYALALHLSLLLAWPPVHALGVPSIHDSGLVDRYRMTRLLCNLRANSSLDRTIVYPFIGTIIGAWLGAVPIPLDWDRPWQSWPLTVAAGALAGFTLGGTAVWVQMGAAELLIGPEAPGPAIMTTRDRASRRKAKKA